MKKVLFVCLSNVCRSPAAEAVMRDLLIDERLMHHFKIDSAGITSQHAGEMVDVRMRNHMESRGLRIDNRARRFRAEEDFENFDYIVAMDHDNLRELMALDPEGFYTEKLHLLTEYCSDTMKAEDVNDPFYGKDEEFETVLDIIEDGVNGLLYKLCSEMAKQAA
jgi:protein-tyrosine phosphatase